METAFWDRASSDGEDSEQRRAAEDEAVTLIDLEQQNPVTESKHMQLTSALLRWQHFPHGCSWRLFCAVSSLLLLVVLLSVSNLSALLESLRRTRPSPSGSRLPVLVRRDGISCLGDAAWSPDSRFIAVLGSSQPCSSVSHVSGLVNLYKAPSGQLFRQLHPDDVIVTALKATRTLLAEPSPHGGQQEKGAGSSPVILSTHLVWSPDTQRLAFTFHLLAPSPSTDGIMLMNRDGGHPQVLLQQPGGSSYTEWDGGRSRSVISRTLMLPPALAYQWSPNGTLLPIHVLPSGTLPVAPPPGAIGNPDGGPWLTLWQPALSYEQSVYSSHIFTTHDWKTRFVAWSPDGRSLIPDLSFWGTLDSPEPSTIGNQFVTVITLDQGAQVPRREATLRGITATARGSSDKGTAGSSNPCALLLAAVSTPLAFAWSPNGRVLADYGAGNGVDLYDCTTGHKLASFPLPSTYAAPRADAVALRWSPDGFQLLFSSVASGLVMLWRVEHAHR